MLNSPFVPAVLDDWRVQRVCPDLLPMVFGAATALALRSAANALIESDHIPQRSPKRVRQQCGNRSAAAAVFTADGRTR